MSYRFGLKGNYGRTTGKPGRAGFGAGWGGGMDMAAPNGHLLQIFIHRDVVDHLAYRSHPMGVPVGDTRPISEFLRGPDGPAPAPATPRRGPKHSRAAFGMHAASGPASGQARIFMHPAVFTNPAQSRIYHYCANAAFACPDPAAALSRAAYALELQQALAPLLGSAAALRTTAGGIEGRARP